MCGFVLECIIFRFCYSYSKICKCLQNSVNWTSLLKNKYHVSWYVRLQGFHWPGQLEVWPLRFIKGSNLTPGFWMKDKMFKKLGIFQLKISKMKPVTAKITLASPKLVQPLGLGCIKICTGTKSLTILRLLYQEQTDAELQIYHNLQIKNMTDSQQHCSETLISLSVIPIFS